MNPTIGAAVVAGTAALLGAALGILFQYFRGRQEHKWALEAVKREAYAEFLRSISASYAQAESESQQSHKSETKFRPINRPQVHSQQNHKSEDANLRAATARIMLLAKPDIYESASALSDQVIEAHKALRNGDPTAQEKVAKANRKREKLIMVFKKDLRIPTED
jgi:hypothetical protein